MLDALQHLRRDEVFRSSDSILEDCKQGSSVKIGERAFFISLTVIGKMICGKQLFETGSAAWFVVNNCLRQALHKLQSLRAWYEKPSSWQGFRIYPTFFLFWGGLICRDWIVKLTVWPNALITCVMKWRIFWLDLREDGTQLTLENFKALLMVSHIPQKNLT